MEREKKEGNIESEEREKRKKGKYGQNPLVYFLSFLRLSAWCYLHSVHKLKRLMGTRLNDLTTK